MNLADKPPFCLRRDHDFSAKRTTQGVEVFTVAFSQVAYNYSLLKNIIIVFTRFAKMVGKNPVKS